MALCAKFSRYAALNAHICRGKSPEGSDRARCYAFNSFPLPYECRFNTPLSLVQLYSSCVHRVSESSESVREPTARCPRGAAERSATATATAEPHKRCDDVSVC